MNLEIVTIEKIKLIVEEYKDIKIDCDFFEKVANILNEDELFSGNIKLHFSSKKLIMETDIREENKGNIFININNFLKDISQHTNSFLTEVPLNRLQIYFGLLYFMRECVHVLQSMWAFDNKNDCQKVNNIYLDIINKMNNSKYTKVIYSLNRFSFFTERNANLLALDALNKIYKNDQSLIAINSEYYLYNLFDMYDIKNRKTPMELTYKLIGIKNYDDIYELSFEELVKHGFCLNDKQWKKFERIYNVYKRPYAAPVIEEEILRIVKEM